MRISRIIPYGVFLFILGNLLYLSASDFYLVNEALHASIEAMGAMCAFVLAALSTVIKKHTTLKYYYVWIVCALVSMGLLDLFHALVMPGESFVWLHSTATFVGGLFFALVWLPEHTAGSRFTVVLSRSIIPVSLVFGIFSLAAPDVMPAMLDEGGFTRNAYALNITGGMLFIAASVWFFRRYRRHRAGDDILFGFLCLLFGVAGIIFVYSELWDSEWWLWHAIRLPAYLLLLVYSFNAYKELGDELEKAKGELEKRVEERTSELNSTVDLLSKEVAERKMAEKKIKAALRDKEILMKEIHHRVKNNMMVISSLLNLQSRRVADERYRAMFDDSIERIKAMASVHERLYRYDDLSKIMFSEYIHDMVKNIYNSYSMSSRIRLTTQIDEVILGIDASIPSGLIVNELITNSMKYAFPGNRRGEIRVALHSNDKGEIQLTVSDNGVGIPEEVDFRKTDSLGLTLINGLVRQLNGEVELNRENGTEFIITFNVTAE